MTATAKTKQPLSAEDKQFNRNKWLFGVSGIGRDMSYQLIASFLLTYVQFGVTLNVAQFTTISLIIGIAGRIWDAINDPMMGAIIEGTHMKWGKFVPWIFIGAISCGAVIIAMFNVQRFAGWAFVVFITLMYLLWESTFTMNDIGYWSMLASLSSKKEQRNSATMLTVVFAGVGAFIAQGGISFLYPGDVKNAFRWISIGVVAVFVSMQVVMSLLIKERPRSEMEVNENVSLKRMWDTIKHNDQILWMTLSMLFYNIGSSLLVGMAYNLYYLEIGYNGQTIIFIAIFGVVNIGVQVLYPKIVAKLGRKKLQKYSIILACIGYLGIASLGWGNFIPFNLVTLSIFGVMVFAGQALYYMACIINMTNCVEYNEYKRGERNEAVVSTLRPFMAKFADAMKYGIQTLALILSGVFLLSQNISTLENQKGFFQRMDYDTQIAYVEAVKGYLDDDLSGADQSVIDQINAELSNDSVLSGYQIEAQYLSALGEVKIYNVEDEIYLGALKEVDVADMVSGKTYSLEITGDDFNVADQVFRDNRTTAERIWIRVCVSVIPIVMIVLSLIVQNKKFIIDEDYYDMMLEEIEKRKAGQGAPETQPTEA